MSTTLVLSSARCRLTSSSTSTSTSTAVRRTIAAATCSKHKSTVAAQNALYYNLFDRQKRSSSFSTTTTVSPTTYDGCLPRNNKQHQSHHQDVVIKAGLMMSHTKRQQITQQQHDHIRKDSHRSSSPLFTSSDNIDTDINRSDTSKNNNNKNDNENNNINSNTHTTASCSTNHNNKNHFSRLPPLSLLRLCEFNQQLSSPSFLSSKLSHFHQYQHQHQHHLSSSSSLSLSSPMMMLMPALCCPSRMCSSSSSSSPSSENNKGQNENNDNDDNNNDKIDVTSFAETAKKILQKQKIATLICTKTVRDVLPSDYFDEENLVKNEKLFTEQTYKSNLPVIAKVDSMPAAAILSSPTASDLSLTEQQFEMISHFVATLQFHPTMRKFINKDNDFRLAAKLNGLKIITVYDWYKSPKVHRRFDDEQLAFIDESCAAPFEKAKEENKRQEQIRTSTRNLAEKVSVDPALLPGKSYRHTWPFGFGLLARNTALSLLKDAVRRFKRDAKKEDLPLLIIRSMPRQGKTRLGDELGHRKDFYEMLNSGSANKKNTFIFNLSFNANWEVKQLDQAEVSDATIKASEKNQQSNIQRTIDHRVEKEEKKKTPNGSKDASVLDSDEIRKRVKIEVEKEFKVEGKDDKELLVRVEKELCRRVVAAAVGIFRSNDYAGKKKAICEAFIEAHDCDFDLISGKIQEIVAAKGGCEDVTKAHFVFVFDEITNLEEKLNGKTALKAHFYSSIASLIGSRCAVLLSGFSEAKEALSMSGRNVKTIVISPVSSVNLRRELHTMKTKFFNLCAVALNAEQSSAKSLPSSSSTTTTTATTTSSSSSTTISSQKQDQVAAAANAIFFYELVKSAPGLLGTLLEHLRIDPSTASLKDIVRKEIPAIGFFSKEIDKYRDNKSNDVMMPPLLESMVNILQLKSLLFWSPQDDDVSSTSSFYLMLVHGCLHRAIQNKVVDASLGEGLKDLYLARLEPLFLDVYLESTDFFGQSSGLQQYWTKLKLFSQIASRITDERRILGEDLPSVLSGFQGQLDNKTKTRIEKYINTTPEDQLKNKREDLNGYFFEDAIADGLLFQRQLRRELINYPEENTHNLDNNSASHSSTLRQYLDGSRVICSIQMKNAGNLRQRQSKKDGTSLRGFVSESFPRGRILWSRSSSSSSSSSANIIEFEGHFPCQSFQNADVITKEQCDSLDYVLRPRRIDSDGDPECNPLVDVIFNERFQDGDSDSNSDELVQFWIDGKHRTDSIAPFTNERKKDGSSSEPFFNRTNLGYGLTEIYRRIKDEHHRSKIRHIVHIIITPFREKDVGFETAVKKVYGDIYDNTYIPSPLKSYTLCLVSPDDLSSKKAFENLVSQPIALTAPLIEQQMQDSWTHRLPPPSQWWNYNATDGCRSRVRDRRKKRQGFTLSHKQEENLLHKWCPVASRMSIPGDFKQWRGIRFNGDCAVGIGHLFKTESEAFHQMSFEGTPREYMTKESDTNFEAVPSVNTLEIPFGCILEALGILPPRVHGTFYCQYDTEDFRFKLSLVADNNNNNNDNTNNTTTSSSSSSSTVCFEITIIDEKPFDAKWLLKVERVWLLDRIRVGHILRFDYPDTPKTHDVDYQESDTASKCWKKKFEEYRALPSGFKEKDKSISSDSQEEIADDRKRREHEQKTMLTCSDLWNMSLSEFAEVLMVSSKDNDGNSKRNNKSEEDEILDKLLKCDAVELSKYVGSKIDDYNFKI